MDTNGVEQVNVNALGGADTVTTNDLTGTGVTKVNVDLGAGDAARPTTWSSTARTPPMGSRSPAATATPA